MNNKQTVKNIDGSGFFGTTRKKEPRKDKQNGEFHKKPSPPVGKCRPPCVGGMPSVRNRYVQKNRKNNYRQSYPPVKQNVICVFGNHRAKYMTFF